VSELLEKAFDKLTEVVAKEGDKLLERKGDKTFDDAISEVEKFGKGHADLLGKDGAAFVDETVLILRRTKTPFLALTQAEFTAIVAHWGSQQEAEARRLYLEKKATFAERRAAMQAAGDAVFNVQKLRQENWAQIVEVFKAIGKKGLKLVAAALLASVGL